MAREPQLTFRLVRVVEPEEERTAPRATINLCRPESPSPFLTLPTASTLSDLSRNTNEPSKWPEESRFASP